jgi:hypothetical protein
MRESTCALLAAAALAACSPAANGSAASPARPHAPVSDTDAAARAIVPTCVAPAAAALPKPWMSMHEGGRLEVTLPADGKVALADARFAFDPGRRTYKPLNDEARRVVDLRTGCASP